MSIRVVGLGAGGHAKVVIEILRLDTQYELIGMLDIDPSLIGSSILGVPILGDDHLLAELKSQGVEYFFVGLGSTSDMYPRRRLYELATGESLLPVAAIHPTANISPSATLGHGPTVMGGATINAAAKLGDNVIVNTAAVVEHDCLIGHHVHIATGARLASAVQVGDCTHIGVGATVRQLIRIGCQAVVGAGAVVVRDVPDRTTVVGVPARVVKEEGPSG